MPEWKGECALAHEQKLTRCMLTRNCTETMYLVTDYWSVRDRFISGNFLKCDFIFVFTSNHTHMSAVHFSRSTTTPMKKRNGNSSSASFSSWKNKNKKQNDKFHSILCVCIQTEAHGRIEITRKRDTHSFLVQTIFLIRKCLPLILDGWLTECRAHLFVAIGVASAHMQT